MPGNAITAPYCLPVVAAVAPPIRATRPPFVSCVIRLLVCATDDSTSADELRQQIERAAEELTPAERSLALTAARSCILAIRHGANVAAALS